MRWRWGGDSLKGRMTKSADLNQADWFQEGGQEDDWTIVMMSVIRLIVWDSVRHVNRKVAEHIMRLRPY